MADEIACCPNHDEYITPLLSTFAFPYREWWCPFCGYGTGLFGPVRSPRATAELSTRHDTYRAASRAYLHAAAMMNGAMVERGGNCLRLYELPEDERESLVATFEAGWARGVRAEDLHAEPVK